jgi:hypothetical protein
MGGAVRAITGKASSREKPQAEYYGNPYTEELMARVLGAIDRYNEKRGGIRQYIPKENLPYEMRPDAERDAIRAREAQDADDDNRPARRLGINEPDENDVPEIEESEDSGEMVSAKMKTKQMQGEVEEEDLASVAQTYNADKRRQKLNAMLKTSQYRPSFSRKRRQESDDEDYLSGG